MGIFIKTWQDASDKSNDSIEKCNKLHNFLIHHNMVETIQHLNPHFISGKTYIDGSKRIDHIFLTPELADLAIKAGHHPFLQHFTSGHKGVYVHFQVQNIFSLATFFCFLHTYERFEYTL